MTNTVRAAGDERANDDRRKSGKPKIWVSWIKAHLAGTDKCFWSPWYRAHYKFAKIEREDEGSLDAWKATHDIMVDRRERELLEAGYIVGVEDDNLVELEGKTAIVVCKPDLVATKNGTAIVIDEKSGKPRPEDAWQVKVYMFALPLCVESMKPLTITGEVEYMPDKPNPRVFVPSITPDDYANIVRVIKIVGADEPPKHTPSRGECQFCDIANCTERVAGRQKPTVGTTAEF